MLVLCAFYIIWIKYIHARIFATHVYNLECTGLVCQLLYAIIQFIKCVVCLFFLRCDVAKSAIYVLLFLYFAVFKLSL